jgi:hypothetical protein
MAGRWELTDEQLELVEPNLRPRGREDTPFSHAGHAMDWFHIQKVDSSFSASTEQIETDWSD